ncbi:MAG TPA: hypothetical protein VIC04_09205 [Terriglobia bacterium]
MENQHRKITGYRELNEAEVDAMNRIKAAAEEVGALVDWLKAGVPGFLDQRWIAIGATDLQKGFMALTRAVAQPTTF